MNEILKLIILSCQIHAGTGDPQYIQILEQKCRIKLIECVQPKFASERENQRKLLSCLRKKL